MADNKVEINIEACPEAEILALSAQHLEILIPSGEPLVLRTGPAQVLGTFRKNGTKLLTELALGEGGTEESCWPCLGWREGYRCASAARVSAGRCMWWIAQPNLKLRLVLLRRGYEVSGSAYILTEQLTS